MKLGFSAKRDGFSSQKWHDKVDNKGKTLIIIKTKDNFIFGGFTQIGFTTDKSKWRDIDRNYAEGSIPDSNAFIFSLRNDNNDRKPEKFPIKKGKENFAIYYDYSSFGPIFGGRYYSDFSLNLILQPGDSNFGYTYNLPNGIEPKTNEAKRYLAGSYNNWVVDEIECGFI
ncbi:pep-cterm sorting domain-containing protein [Anaeramoeba ignava]|uniref:Pep-cterm sorting domain-containing protein n=1 Tax=Anaeramoeba ignava TaxID=1746090 RepID=A0A9Q0LMV9_ANAIG|nr:pep-cterm sorting domain-containing protein [Anaeramoeba ignava]